MGTTFSSVHIYSPHKVQEYDNFFCFSEGWQTYVPEVEPDDPYSFQKLAKKISKAIDAPVLWFYIFDSEWLCFEFFKNGNKVAAYSQADKMACKKIYDIPAMIGYDNGQKKRLSKILSCSDVEYQVELLEEYFGLCLLSYREVSEDSPQDLCCVRGEQKYQEFINQEKKITGKQSPLKLELLSKRVGKLFDQKAFERKRLARPHYYYLGYEQSDLEELRPVCFRQGELVSVTQEEFDSVRAIKRTSYHIGTEDCFTEEFYPRYKVHFNEKAPEGFRNKTLVTPRGFYFYWFDSKGRAVLSDEHGGIAIVDETLRVVSKMRVKGMPLDLVDDCLLVADGGENFFCRSYDPSCFVRIYRICDK